MDEKASMKTLKYENLFRNLLKYPQTLPLLMEPDSVSRSNSEEGDLSNPYCYEWYAPTSK